MSDVASERAVLAGIFTYGREAYLDVAPIVTVNTFTLDSNQAIYKCMSHYFDTHHDAEVLDYPSILSSAKSIGVAEFFDKPTERDHLRSVMNMPIQLNNVRRLAARIRRLHVGRELQFQVDEIKSSLNNLTGDETIDQILAMAEKPILDFTSLLIDGQGGDPVQIGVGARAFFEHLAANPVDQVGIATGYPTFDFAIGGGLRRKTVNLVGARPKSGKSILAANVAINVAKQNIPVLVLDTEMSLEDQYARIGACLSDVPINDIETGKFASNEHKKQCIDKAVDLLENIPFYYKSIAGQPFEETVALIRRWVTKVVKFHESGQANDCVIIFDYLKLMSDDSLKSMAEFQALGFMMTGLHNLSVRLGVPIFAFAQLNRDGIDRESTDVVSQSDRIIWLCSNFSILKKKTDEELAENVGYDRKLVPVIARHGEGLADGDYINLKFEGSKGRFTEGPTRNSLHKSRINDDGGEQVQF